MNLFNVRNMGTSFFKIVHNAICGILNSLKSGSFLGTFKLGKIKVHKIVISLMTLFTVGNVVLSNHRFVLIGHNAICGKNSNRQPATYLQIR